ncbi:hypothetical protein LguiA_033324 [Lonicera macranthoides]
MEDDHQPHPSLPSNYVSVVDLRERWLQEQHKKQREKEEHQDRKKLQQHPHKQKSPSENGEHNTLSVTPRPFQTNRGTSDRKPELEESKIEALVPSHSQDELKLKLRDKRVRGKHRKPRVTGGTSKLAPVTNGENEQITSKFRRIDHKVREPQVPVLDRTATPEELNFEEFSLNEGKACIRSAGEMNSFRRKYGGGSERVNNRRNIWKQTDRNLVWVKKGDITGADITGIQSSGTLAKAGVDTQKQQPGNSKQKYSTPRD